jgi:hypothetical protein
MSNDQETKTQAFVIRVLLDENNKGWRGYIIAPPDFEKYNFSNLFGIILFIVPYLKKMGVRVSWFWRMISWYKSLKSDSQCVNKEMT